MRYKKLSEITYIFDFIRTPLFFDEFNLSFLLSDMDGSSEKFSFVFCSTAPSNIGECLNNDGTLDDSVVTVLDTVDCALLWNDNCISVSGDATYTIGDTRVPLKAIFLLDKTTSFVMGYSINSNSFEVTNEVQFDDGTVLYTFYDGDGENV